MRKAAEMMFEKEKENARDTISWSVFRLFLADSVDEEIGKRRVGTETKATTLRSEIAEIGRLIALADVKQVNYYASRTAFSLAEISDEERIARAEKSYNLAVQKIMWLSTVCKEKQGCGFISRFIHKTDAADVRSLIDAFSFMLRHPSEMAD